MIDLSCESILPFLQKDFNLLWNCERRGNTLEIVTPFSTTNDKFASVFVTTKNGDLIVTDAGWLSSEENLYQVSADIDDAEVESIQTHYAAVLRIARFTDAAGNLFFFKRVEKPELLSAAVYDVANFVVSVVNWMTLPREAKDEAQHRKTFHGKATKFIRETFGDKQKDVVAIKQNYRLDDVKDAWFNVGLIYNSQISLIGYVTGYSETKFSTDFKKSIVNFELAEGSRLSNSIKSRIAFINDDAEGYNPRRNAELYRLLESHSGKAIPWSERASIIEFA